MTSQAFRAGLLSCSLLAGASLAAPLSADACSRVFWNDNGVAMVVGRTMDLYVDDRAAMELRPRGTVEGGFVGVTDQNPLRWTSKYGSVGIKSFGQAVSDGMNEKGLDANLLYLSGTQYEKRDLSKPGVANSKLILYVLDNFATVDAALAALSGVQIVSDKAKGREWPLHLSLADATGDSAVVEFVAGRVVIHHGKQIRVMTNEPPLDQQLAALKRYKPFGGTESLPGDVNPEARFVRASTFLKTLPKPSTDLDVLAGVYAVMKTISVPAGARDWTGGTHEDSWTTLWTTLADLSDGTYYFQSARSPFPVWVNFAHLNVAAGGPVRLLDLTPKDVSGDVSGRLNDAPAP